MDGGRQYLPQTKILHVSLPPYWNVHLTWFASANISCHLTTDPFTFCPFQSACTHISSLVTYTSVNMYPEWYADDFTRLFLSPTTSICLRIIHICRWTSWRFRLLQTFIWTIFLRLVRLVQGSHLPRSLRSPCHLRLESPSVRTTHIAAMHFTLWSARLCCSQFRGSWLQQTVPQHMLGQPRKCPNGNRSGNNGGDLRFSLGFSA